MVTDKNLSTKGSEKIKGESSIISKIKGFFQKFKKSPSGEKRTTKLFNLTRKDAIVSVLLALGVVIGAVLYGMKVWGDYTKLNNNADSLKNLSSYNVKLNENSISSYFDGKKESLSIGEVITAYENIEKEIKEYSIFEEQQRSYYEILLQNIYLPSLNVWKDPYTKNFDMTVLGQKYLEKDKSQDLFLIQYWSDFFKYVGNDADYNTIESISIGDKVIIPDNPKYFYTPISVSFTSPNKRSFLLLVNKLSTTSNQSNISLVNELFFYLLNAIKEEKSDIIDQLMEKYWDEFASSSDRDGPSKLSELTEEEKSGYVDRVIGYYLYHWINDDGIVEKENPLIDDKIIVKAIRQGTLCNASDSDQKCFYNFREKYRNLPYLAYNIGLEKQANRTDGLRNFLHDLPSIIAITDFGFEKYSNSSFLNNESEQYEGNVRFNAYGRNVTDEELEEAASSLGKLCLGNNSSQKISVELALSRVNETIASYGGDNEYRNVTSLGELQGLFTSIQKEYKNMENYEKMVKLFEIWRMMNDANLCAQ